MEPNFCESIHRAYSNRKDGTFFNETCLQLKFWENEDQDKRPPFLADLRMFFMNDLLASKLTAHLQRKIDRKTQLLQTIAKDRPQFVPPTEINFDASVGLVQTEESGKQKTQVYVASHNEDVREFNESSTDVLSQKVQVLKDLLLDSKYCTVFTGAGISTAASLPDYRSNTGIWSKLERGQEISTNLTDTLSSAQPTIAHHVLASLVDHELCKCVITTNIDGLHENAGIPPSKLAELHGNCFKERCAVCKKEYKRSFVVNKAAIGTHGNSHQTGRKCEEQNCEGELVDTIVNFGESLPESVFQLASVESNKSDLSIVIGSSMRVSPSCTMPLRAFENGGKLVIINKQNTAFEDHAWLHIYGSIDEVLSKLSSGMQLL